MFHAACLAVSVYVTVGVRLSVSQSVSSIDSSSDVQPVCCSSGRAADIDAAGARAQQRAASC